MLSGSELPPARRGLGPRLARGVPIMRLREPRAKWVERNGVRFDFTNPSHSAPVPLLRYLISAIIPPSPPVAASHLPSGLNATEKAPSENVVTTSPWLGSELSEGQRRTLLSKLAEAIY